jgi:copper chaperone CopZ
VRVAVQKLDGVESVDVSLERASVTIGLRPGNRITLPLLRQLIRNNGFSAKDATVTAVGTVIERGGKPALSVTGTDVVWLLAPRAANDAAYADAMQRVKAQQPAPVEAAGTVAAPANESQPEVLLLQALKAAGK